MVQPMKNIDLLKPSTLSPKKSTVSFILNYSKSLHIIRVKGKTLTVVKN